MPLNSDLTRLANSANVLATEITTNATAITSMSVSGNVRIGNSSANVSITNNAVYINNNAVSPLATRNRIINGGTGGTGTSGRFAYYTTTWLNGGTFSVVPPTSSTEGFYVGHNLASTIETQFAWSASAEL